MKYRSDQTLGVGIHGLNGHQIHQKLASHPRCLFVAASAFPQAALPTRSEKVTIYSDLAALLSDPHVEVVSLCSPRRETQAQDAIRCLEAGKHVLAEKPCALSEADLDAVIDAADRSGRVFHEMAGSAFEQPWRELGRVVRGGRVGQLRQFFAQKSYPFFEGRPVDPGVDGGILLQAGIHAARWIIHGLGLSIRAIHTRSCLAGSGMVTAVSGLVETMEGAHGVISINYLNPRSVSLWGNDVLRVWGDAGMAEITEGGRKSRLFVHEHDCGPLLVSEKSLDWLDVLIEEVLDRRPPPIDLVTELAPLRALLRARPI